ncbi:MAG: hypothetical protein RI909_815 [Bacteroidota bacterium]|jgi:hypothetical protein
MAEEVGCCLMKLGKHFKGFWLFAIRWDHQSTNNQ